MLCDRAAEHLDDELTMSKSQSPLLNFGEAVLAKESGVQVGKLGPSWDLGIWMGRSTRTIEHAVGTRTGVIRARIVKRRPETLNWDRELYDAMNFVPWLVDGLTAESTSRPSSRIPALRMSVKRTSAASESDTTEDAHACFAGEQSACVFGVEVLDAGKRVKTPSMMRPYKMFNRPYRTCTSYANCLQKKKKSSTGRERGTLWMLCNMQDTA